jgi:hypothetical protein
MLHTANDALRLGRALETLMPCAEILIVDHHSSDPTRRIASQYGVRLVTADERSSAEYFKLARHDWIFCLTPSESITESLQATLFEWASLPGEIENGSHGFCVVVREQADRVWRELGSPETRLVPRTWKLWNEQLPAYDPKSVLLEGELLRISFP